MPTITVYKPDGKVRYREAEKVQLNHGVLEFATAEGTLRTETPNTGPEVSMRLDHVHHIKTNLPFFVEQER
jgi:hypothetical protein